MTDTNLFFPHLRGKHSNTSVDHVTPLRRRSFTSRCEEGRPEPRRAFWPGGARVLGEVTRVVLPGRQPGGL